MGPQADAAGRHLHVGRFGTGNCRRHRERVSHFSFTDGMLDMIIASFVLGRHMLAHKSRRIDLLVLGSLLITVALLSLCLDLHAPFHLPGV